MARGRVIFSSVPLLVVFQIGLGLVQVATLAAGEPRLHLVQPNVPLIATFGHKLPSTVRTGLLPTPVVLQQDMALELVLHHK